MASDYTTRAGDTFDSIALSELGDEAHLGLVALANPAHAYVLEFSDGVTLTIPDTPRPAPDSALPPWRVST